MLIVRPTKKLAKQLRYTLSPTNQESTTRLGDWYANKYQFGRNHWILCVSERARLPVLLPAKDAKNFPARLQETLQLLLTAFGISPSLIQGEIAEMQEIVYAKSASRSVLGTMNDYGTALSFYDLRTANPLMGYEASLWLAEIPSGAMAYERPDVVTPRLFAADAPADATRSP
ncbi:MAG TPA: hypothetical protein P5121_32050 [Caldilineaceae bacterium]|nr:hypothetical protein [Caldilineaceae bacterium]